MAEDMNGESLSVGDQVRWHDHEYEVEAMVKNHRGEPLLKLLGHDEPIREWEVEVVEKAHGLDFVMPDIEDADQILGVRRYAKGFQLVRYSARSERDMTKRIEVTKAFNVHGDELPLDDPTDPDSVAKWVVVNQLGPNPHRANEETQPGKPPKRRAPQGGTGTEPTSNPFGYGSPENADGLPASVDPKNYSVVPWMERTTDSAGAYSKRDTSERVLMADPVLLNAERDHDYELWANGYCAPEYEDSDSADDVAKAEVEWDESKHPRDDHGRFGHGGGTRTADRPAGDLSPAGASFVRQPSIYQKAIFNRISQLAKEPRGALVVDAVAGAGKSTTIVDSLKLIPPHQSVVFMSFGKDIATELEHKTQAAGMGDKVLSTTVNSFGWAACRKAYPYTKEQIIKHCEEAGLPTPEFSKWGQGPALDDHKLDHLTKLSIFGTVKPKDPSPEDKRFYEEHGNDIRDLVSKKKLYYSEDENGKFNGLSVHEIAAKHGIEIPDGPDGDRFLKTAGDVWKRSINETHVMDFADQILFPAWKKLPLADKRNRLGPIKPDWVMVDETQDLNATQATFVKRIAPRTIMVGDPHQSIFGFAGADSRSMEKLQSHFHAENLPLSITYRCSKAVVREAQQYVPHIQAKDDAPEGSVSSIKHNQLVESLKPGDRVVSRVNAPLVEACLAAIGDGKKATIMGRDIGKSLDKELSRIKGPDGKKITDKTSIEDFNKALVAHQEREVKRLVSAGKEHLVPGLEDKIATYHALSAGLNHVGDIKGRIAKIFNPDISAVTDPKERERIKAGIIFSSIHKAKGLEADRVFYMQQHPSKRKLTPDEAQQEQNLRYVAVTRAKKDLVYVAPPPKEEMEKRDQRESCALCKKPMPCIHFDVDGNLTDAGERALERIQRARGSRVAKDGGGSSGGAPSASGDLSTSDLGASGGLLTPSQAGDGRRRPKVHEYVDPWHRSNAKKEEPKVADHRIEKCSCGTVIMQCRCPSPDKKVIVVPNGCTRCRGGAHGFDANNVPKGPEK